MDFLDREWLKIVIGIGAVLLVTLISVLFVKMSDKARTNAYDTATAAYRNNQPEAIELLKKFADKYGNTSDGSAVLIQLGNHFLTTKEYDLSEKYYKKYVQKSNNDPVYAFNAYNGLGAVYESKGNFAEAGKVYEQYISKFTDSVFLPNMYLMAGKAYYNAGNRESSLKCLNKIVDEYKDSQMFQEAVFYKEILDSQASTTEKK